MELDPTTCYAAIASRDRRFEGRFVVGVVTTGVYCRPGCPAPMPRRKNVKFYRCAAAAEEAGFRPCLRCRPESSPGTPAWMGTSATVSRALRLLLSSEEEELGIEELAARLGVGSRHLRRLFVTHVGASPRAIVATRRAHFAKKLIEETNLTMTAIAFASGYPNVRRFNAAIRRSFRNTPGRLRENRPAALSPARPASNNSGAHPVRRAPAGRGAGAEYGARPTGAGTDALVLKLPFKPPFDWNRMVTFFSLRAVPGIETCDAAAYRRTIRAGDTTGIIEVRPVPGMHHLELRVHGPVSPDLPAIVERVNRIFDLTCDPADIAEHLGRDPVLATTTTLQAGPRVPGAWDPFEMAVRGLLGQQVSVKGAVTLTGRLVERFGEALPAGDGNGLTHLFPTAEVLARNDVSAIGIPKSRAATIRDLAAAVQDGSVRLDRYRDLEETVEELCAVKGVGAWTAHYIAMRGLSHPDAFPSSDLGLLKTAERWGKDPKPKNLEAIAEAWRPWRAYAVIALWMSLGNEKEKADVDHDSPVRAGHAGRKAGSAAPERNTRDARVRRSRRKASR